MNFRQHRQEDVTINMTPLIDVVFLLLIFFMVSTTFSKETHIDLELPTSTSTEQAPDSMPLEVVVNASGGFVVNGKPLVQSSLSSLIKAIQADLVNYEDENPVIYVVADAQAPHQSVVYALDAAGQLGLTQVRMATRMAAE